MWIFRWYPELARVELSQRLVILRDAVRDAVRRNPWFFITSGAIFAVIMSPIVVWIHDHYSDEKALGMGVLSALVVLTMLIGFMERVFRPVRTEVRRQVLARGLPICIRCGYDLTGNVTGSCPECGDFVQGTPNV
ncbi:MAG: hypothetical protein ACYTHJ_00815 [Planctomycetota bacterium]|jgi:hypothetical protein